MSPRLPAMLLLVAVSACGPRGGVRPVKDSALLARLGGIEALGTLVDRWIALASTDPEIRDFFAGVDIGRLKSLLLARLCVLADGPCHYEGRSMFEAHEKLKLRPQHERAFLADFDAALSQLDAEEVDKTEFRELLRGLAAELAIGVSEIEDAESPQ